MNPREAARTCAVDNPPRIPSPKRRSEPHLYHGKKLYNNFL